MIIAVSMVSRKTMKKTGTAKTLGAMACLRVTLGSRLSRGGQRRRGRRKAGICGKKRKRESEGVREFGKRSKKTSAVSSRPSRDLFDS